MNRRLFAASTLTTAVGLALAMQAPAVRAQGAMDLSKAPQIVKEVHQVIDLLHPRHFRHRRPWSPRQARSPSLAGQ